MTNTYNQNVETMQNYDPTEMDQRILDFATRIAEYHKTHKVAEAHTLIGLPVVMGGLRAPQESELENI